MIRLATLVCPGIPAIDFRRCSRTGTLTVLLALLLTGFPWPGDYIALAGISTRDQTAPAQFGETHAAAVERSGDTDGAEMVSVPAGEFWMGNDPSDLVDVIEECKQNGLIDCRHYQSEQPRRKVYLDAFWIDKFEVTNALYRRFVSATGRRAPRYWRSRTWSGPKRPVIGTDWNDAEAYCRWAGKRLPTEAEWEKAARGTDGRRYPWGNIWDPRKANAYKTRDDREWTGETEDVGSNPEGISPYGAHDMAGNVWEWVADWYDAKYYRRAPNRNPKGPDSGKMRVVRGGSWQRSLSQHPSYLRASHRSYEEPTYSFDNIGFRCAR